MLNLYKTYIKNKHSLNNNNNIINIKKHFPSSREWKNIFYSFNNKNINSVFESSKISLSFVKNFFNLYNRNLEVKLKELNRWKKYKSLSSNKIFVSNRINNHTNDKVNLTLYTFNKQNLNLNFFIKKQYSHFIYKRLLKNFIKFKLNYFNRLNKNKYILLNILHNNKLIENKYKIQLTEKVLNCYKNFNINLLKNVCAKYNDYFLYRQLIFVNNTKYNYNYLYHLTYILKKVYNKNIEYNIINLKQPYLNSDIITELLLLKIKGNRKKTKRFMKTMMSIVNIKKVSKYISLEGKITKKQLENNVYYKNYLNKSIKKTVLNLLKYKLTTGIRMEAKGRLSRRFTASRSMFILRSKGNLVNIDSSYLGLSTVYLKGNLKSNIQYTKLNSKTRIGSFGLKGWVSSYY